MMRGGLAGELGPYSRTTATPSGACVGSPRGHPAPVLIAASPAAKTVNGGRQRCGGVRAALRLPLRCRDRLGAPRRCSRRGTAPARRRCCRQCNASNQRRLPIGQPTCAHRPVAVDVQQRRSGRRTAAAAASARDRTVGGRRPRRRSRRRHQFARHSTAIVLAPPSRRHGVWRAGTRQGCGLRPQKPRKTAVTGRRRPSAQPYGANCAQYRGRSFQRRADKFDCHWSLRVARSRRTTSISRRSITSPSAPAGGWRPRSV